MTETIDKCATCGAAIENINQTGILCSSCFEEQNAPPGGGWRQYVSGPAVGGLAFALVPFVLSFSINAVNFVALVGGGVAVGAGGLGAVMGMRKGEAGKKSVMGAGMVVLIGLYQLYRSGFWYLF